MDLLDFRKDISEIMSNSSIFALTSRVEGFGMVLIEAMANGCACVSLMMAEGKAKLFHLVLMV